MEPVMSSIEERLGVEGLRDESLKDYDSVEDGNYKAVIGKVYADQSKNGVGFHVIEFLLLQNEKDGKVKDFMLAAVTNDGVKISLKKRKDGTYAYETVIHKAFFWDIDEANDSQGNKQFKTIRRRHLAAALKSLDGDIVKWSRIANCAGKVVSFTLAKNTDKSGKIWPPQIDVDSIVDLQDRVPIDNIVEIYETIKKLQEAPMVPQPEAPPDKEDLPF